MKAMALWFRYQALIAASPAPLTVTRPRASTPAADGLPREIRVVGIDVEAEQRQPETLLPRPRPVARAGIAALLREHRFDVIAKAPAEGLILARNGDVRGRRMSVD